MYSCDLSFHQNPRRNVLWLFLAFFWVAGLLSGIWICCRSGILVTSAMRRIFSCPVSIIGLLTASCLPFLLSVLTVSLNCPLLLLPLTFADSVLLGIVSFAICGIYGTAGWLLRLLFCFSTFCSAPLTIYYRLRCLSNQKRASVPEVLLIASVNVLIGCIDYSYVSPFLANLLF